MDKDDMVEIESFENIRNLFINLIKMRNKIILWQNIEDMGRLKKIVQFRRFDAKKLELVFLPKSGLFEFDAKLPIYFYSAKRTTIFKRMIFYNSNYNLTLKMPELILLKNIRKDDRESVEDDMAHIMFGENHSGRDSWFKVKMIDRSSGGFSFKSSVGNVVKFQIGQKLDFKFGGMPQYCSGEVVNVMTYLSDDQNVKYRRISVRNLMEEKLP